MITDHLETSNWVGMYVLTNNSYGIHGSSVGKFSRPVIFNTFWRALLHELKSHLLRVHTWEEHVLMHNLTIQSISF